MAKLFISYSHSDEDLRAQLEKQLTTLKRQNVIEVWHDRKIGAGEEFAFEIDKHIESDDIILLLVSPDFISSEYCYAREMTRAMERHQSGVAIVIPVILRACEWQETPFGKLLATPPDGRPVTQYPDRDQALLEVAKAVRAAAQRIPTSKAGPPAPTSGPAAASPTLSEPHRASRGEAEPNAEARPTVTKRSMRWFLSIPTVVFSRNEASAPHIEIDAITQINEELIAQHHIEGLIIDIDQTVVPQSKADISDYIVAHIKHLATLLNGKICFLTNEPDETRERAFRAHTGISVISGSWRKPERDAFTKALEHLGLEASEKVAMVGDRRWTDVLGAKKAHLKTILVNPINPAKDAFGVGIARSVEVQSARVGKKIYFSFLAVVALNVIVNLGIAFSFILGSWQGAPTKYLSYISDYKTLWMTLFVASFMLYSMVIRTARASALSVTTGPIQSYFNTFPLAFRFVASLIILAVILWQYKNEQLVQVGLIFCLFTSLTLGFSIFPFYHSEGMRLFRIVADMSLVVIMAVGLQEYYKFLALLYLSVPIATSSRHFGYTILLTGGGSAVILASFFLLEFGPYDHAAVVLTIILLVTYVMTALTIRLEYTDLSQPYLDFVRHYEDSREVDRLSSYLRGTARSINCTGIILVKLFEGGAFFFSENRVPFGRLTKSTAAELGRFISARSENLNLLRLNRPTNVSLHSSIMREIEEILYPPIKGGITAAMAVRVPQTTDVYLIAINPLSRNGATRSQFWITHTVVIRVLALGIGISLNQFIRDRDFRIAGGA